MNQIGDGLDIEALDNENKEGVMLAETEAIPKSKGKGGRKAVSWWDDKCREAVTNSNKAFKVMKRTHNFQAMLQYKQA